MRKVPDRDDATDRAEVSWPTDDAPTGRGDRERRSRIDQRARFQEVKADIDKRIRPMCNHMPEPEVDALIVRMTRLYLKYEAQTATWPVGSAQAR